MENGDDAIAFLLRQGRFADAPTPDLILLDLNIPRKSGLEVLAEIKRDPDLKFVPVIVLTSSASQDREEGKTSGETESRLAVNPKADPPRACRPLIISGAWRGSAKTGRRPGSCSVSMTRVRWIVSTPEQWADRVPIPNVDCRSIRSECHRCYDADSTIRGIAGFWRSR